MNQSHINIVSFVLNIQNNYEIQLNINQIISLNLNINNYEH